jgi:hypothetical protein
VAGGYLALNYQTYRDKDHTAAERMKRYRERLAGKRPKRGSKRGSKTQRQVRASNLAREGRFVAASEAGDEERAARIAAGEE